MSNRETFLNALMAIDFDKDFFAFHAKHLHPKGMELSDIKVIGEIVNGLGYPVKHFKKENFFQHVSPEPFGKTGFEAQLVYKTQVEFSLILVIGNENLGRSYYGLAHAIAALRTGGEENSLPGPKMTFLNVDEFREILQYGVDLFRRAREAIIDAL